MSYYLAGQIFNLMGLFAAIGNGWRMGLFVWFIYIYIYIYIKMSFFSIFIRRSLESLDLRVLNRKDLGLFFLFILLWLFEFIKIILLVILEELWVNNSMNGQILFLNLGYLYLNFLFGLKVWNYLRSEVIFFQNSRGAGKYTTLKF